MFNGEFVNDEAQHFAARIRESAGDDVAKQIGIAFELAFSRVPSDIELQKFREFIEAEPSRENALVCLCRILYNSNEFIYVD